MGTSRARTGYGSSVAWFKSFSFYRSNRLSARRGGISRWAPDQLSSTETARVTRDTPIGVCPSRPVSRLTGRDICPVNVPSRPGVPLTVGKPYEVLPYADARFRSEVGVGANERLAEGPL